MGISHNSLYTQKLAQNPSSSMYHTTGLGVKEVLDGEDAAPANPYLALLPHPAGTTCRWGEVRPVARVFGILRGGVSKIAAAGSTSTFEKGRAPPRRAMRFFWGVTGPAPGGRRSPAAPGYRGGGHKTAGRATGRFTW
jgi:hypothetical protein